MTITIIVALWRHRLNLFGYRKPADVRIIAVGPISCLTDEQCVDIFYQINCKNQTDHSYLSLAQKVHELASNYGATTRYICVFERDLQETIAKIRFSLDIEGTVPEHVELLLHSRDLKTIAKRNGLITARSCTISSQSIVEKWKEKLIWQIGTFPMFVKAILNDDNRCTRLHYIANSFESLQEWVKAQSNCITELHIEECLQNGNEFIAVCSKLGLIGTIVTTYSKRPVLYNVHKQIPYALEYLPVDKTRDHYPGIESFVLQTTKSVFIKSSYSLLFIRGFYKGHSDIYFMGASLEPPSKTHASLIYLARNSRSWEVLLLENLNFPQNHNGDICSNDSCTYYAVINFPTTEGVLLHQTSIPKHNSQQRVIWRASEGDVMYDATHIDENIYLFHTNRDEFFSDITEIIQKTDIPMDRLCFIDRYHICPRHRQLNQRPYGSNSLVRSSTTTD